MDKFLVAAPPPTVENPSPPPPPPRRHRWSRVAAELDGRIDAKYRRRASRLLVNSYAETRAFDHKYFTNGEERCLTYMHRMINASTQDVGYSSTREGITALEFDTKGIYLASVSYAGCLTVHDFETLYCSIFGSSNSLLDDAANCLLHIPVPFPLCAVRWNPGNQDEVACGSGHSDRVFLFDIGCVSSEPTEVLSKGKSKFSGLNCERYKGLSDLLFATNDKSRLFASGGDGSVYMWDRRLSKTHCLELTTFSQCQLNSIKFDTENQIIFGASRNGIIYAWDLRGGRTTIAFQSHNEVPQLTSLKLSSLLGKITSLKEQSNIVSKEILSIDFDPSCSYQLAFHLDDGWSGILNVNTLSVTHLHCPPPAWLEGTDMLMHSTMRKPSWLPRSSIYAVGSSYDSGIFLLDFYPDTSSACHIDYSEEGRGAEEGRAVQNKFIPLSQRLLSCAAHPLNTTIIGGTQQSSLLLLSQKYETTGNSE